ncbi:unnamed protein product [Strongylus vulgaris]|uniref:Uncharacterized protein n=1 Tax=Strongylus vulgaris TaxID=40348 RepID=A0A3P7K139_STRVU|nr:unnamed protein product [Strongylus vulgaris]
MKQGRINRGEVALELDENSNEVRRNNWVRPVEKSKDSDYASIQQKRYSECSDQVFEDAEKVTECRAANQLNGASADIKPSVMVPPNMQQEHVNQNLSSNPPQYLHEVISRSASLPVSAYNVIPKQTAQELRQRVLAESRSPSTPKSVRAFGFDNRSTHSEAERLSTSNLATRNTATTNDMSYVQPSRISINIVSGSVYTHRHV